MGDTNTGAASGCTKTVGGTVIDLGARIEARNHLRKVLRLVETLDDYYRTSRERQYPAMLAETLRNWSDSDWLTLARFARVNPPSEETRQLVINVYEFRAIKGSVVDARDGGR